MAWDETRSPRFVARHDARDEADAAIVLAQLEATATDLERRLDVHFADFGVVLHGSVAALDAAQPWLPLARRLVAPAARRYVVGWPSERELHVLAPRVLAHRASNVEGSLESLMLSPSALLVRRALAAGHPGLPPPLHPRRLARWGTWAWLVEGGAQWLSGQSRHLRPAVARRLREGRSPAFPPARPDALLLGGSVFELLQAELGREACLTLARGPHPDGPLAALETAFPGRALRHTEAAWRSFIARAPRS